MLSRVPSSELGDPPVSTATDACDVAHSHDTIPPLDEALIVASATFQTPPSHARWLTPPNGFPPPPLSTTPSPSPTVTVTVPTQGTDVQLLDGTASAPSATYPYVPPGTSTTLVPLQPHEVLLQKYKGIVLNKGRYTGTRNEMYLVVDISTQEQYVKMACNTEHTVFTLLSPVDAGIIRSGKVNRGSWVFHRGTGYVYGTRIDKTKSTLHSLVMKHKDQEMAHLSGASVMVNTATDSTHIGSEVLPLTKATINHINRDKLDNRRRNLRWSEQILKKSPTLSHPTSTTLGHSADPPVSNHDGVFEYTASSSLPLEMECTHHLLMNNETIIEQYPALHVQGGRHVGARNFMYLVQNTTTGAQYVKMTCTPNNDRWTILSPVDARLIREKKPRRICWTLHHKTGYVTGSLAGQSIGALHTYVLCNKDLAAGGGDGVGVGTVAVATSSSPFEEVPITYEVGSTQPMYTAPKITAGVGGGVIGTNGEHDKDTPVRLSVDHINDRNKLDNRRENLRWATQTVQNRNVTDKRSRQFNARDLPVGITQEMLPKYVVYYRECYHKEKDLWREFFKVESHPKLAKPMCGSKSGKFTPVEKLAEIKQKLVDLENDVVHEKPLPPYHTIQNFRASPNLVYDHRASDGQRYNLRMKMRAGAEVADEVARLRTKFEKKYPGVVM